MGIMQKFKSLSRGKKVALGAGAVGAAGLGYGAYKLGKKIFGKKRYRASSLSKLRSRVQRKALKIKEKQLDRKLFKEQMRVI